MLRRLKGWFSRNGLGLTLFGLIVALVFAWLTPTIFVFIPPGHAGVYWVRFGSGTVTDRVLGEGVAYKLPWDKIYIYDARMQIIDGSFDALTADGLHVVVDMSIRFRLVRQDIPLLHKNIGPNYVNTLLLPEVNSHSRRVISSYTPEELYSVNRAEIEAAIARDLKNAMAFEHDPQARLENFVFVQELLIKHIQLPVTVMQAIEDKRVQFHLMEGYTFRIEREKKERVRKQIEAMGIRDFQSIVSEGISEQYLKWKGISATLELATSNNAKVVVIGAGEGGLPIILGNVDQPSTTPTGGDDGIADLIGRRSQAPSQPPPAPPSELLVPSELGTLDSPEAPLLNPPETTEAGQIAPR
jgi:regulator of protease activity HflC (stomatin/prohibitin superfamily)